MIVYTLTENWRKDIPSKYHHAILQCLGTVLKVDYGKRIYIKTERHSKTYRVQVESLQQFKKRTAQ